MLFVHSQHKEGQHNQHHTHSRYTVSGRFSEQKEKRYANKRSARETDKLPLGQIEHDLCSVSYTHLTLPTILRV